MAVTLFSHNEKAYRNALKMLSEKGKAAIVHPTGTGKSFIGFKLCEEHPEKRFAGFRLPSISSRLNLKIFPPYQTDISRGM